MPGKYARRTSHAIKDAFRKLKDKITQSKIARSKFIQKTKDIMNSKTMKIAGPIVAIISGAAAFPALVGIVATASAAVLAETATTGSLTVAALMAAYEAYTIAEGIEGAIDLNKLQEDDEIRKALQEIIDVFTREDLPKGNLSLQHQHELLQHQHI